MVTAARSDLANTDIRIVPFGDDGAVIQEMYVRLREHVGDHAEVLVTPAQVRCVGEGCPGLWVPYVRVRLRRGEDPGPPVWTTVKVHLDVADDLCERPLVWVEPFSGDRHGPLAWYVGALGFIEEDAMDAAEIGVGAFSR